MLNAIKELINEKKTIMESADLILEDDQLDDSIILGESKTLSKEEFRKTMQTLLKHTKDVKNVKQEIRSDTMDHDIYDMYNGQPGKYTNKNFNVSNKKIVDAIADAYDGKMTEDEIKNLFRNYNESSNEYFSEGISKEEFRKTMQTLLKHAKNVKDVEKEIRRDTVDHDYFNTNNGNGRDKSKYVNRNFNVSDSKIIDAIVDAYDGKLTYNEIKNSLNKYNEAVEEEFEEAKDDDNDEEEVPFKDEKDKPEEKDEENTTDEEENDLMDTPMDNGEEDNEVPTDDGSDNSSEGDIMDSPVDGNPNDNPVPETDDILDQPVDSTPEDSSDPFDDILSTEINLKTNTMSDILPTPPAHAADVVPSDNDDDLMNQRIDSGFGSDANTLPETNPTNLPVQEDDDFMDQSLDDTSDIDDTEVGVGTEEGEDIPVDDSDDGSMTESAKDVMKSLSDRMKAATKKIKELNTKETPEEAFMALMDSMPKPIKENNEFGEIDDILNEGFSWKDLSPKQRALKKMAERSKNYLASVKKTNDEFNQIVKDIDALDGYNKPSKDINQKISDAKKLVEIQERYAKVSETRKKMLDRARDLNKQSKENLSDSDLNSYIRDMESIYKVIDMLKNKLDDLLEQEHDLKAKMNHNESTEMNYNYSDLLVEAITLGDEGSADSTLSDEDVPTETQEAPAEVSSDETPTEETPTETQEAPSEETSDEQAPDEENSVTSAVKDKVAEAETNDDSTTPESQETAKANEGSVEILKKLASLTKGIEEAKKAVMDKIK